MAPQFIVVYWLTEHLAVDAVYLNVSPGVANNQYRVLSKHCKITRGYF